MTVEGREGPTPAGGVASEAIYDGDGRLVEIVEYDEGGVPVARTYAAGVVARPRRVRGYETQSCDDPTPSSPAPPDLGKKAATSPSPRRRRPGR